MRYRCLALAAAILMAGSLVACGIRARYGAAAPMSQQPGQVTAALTALPEDLSEMQLLAKTGSLVVQGGGEKGVYEVKTATDACRLMQVPLEGCWQVEQMTAAPDGGLWTVVKSREDESLVLMKTGPQGALTVETPLDTARVDSLVCDSIGHVFLAVENGVVWRLSPEGEFQGELQLPVSDQGKTTLAVRKERVFAMERRGQEPGEYMEIFPDFTLGESFSGCVPSAELTPVGSFLEGYTVLEHDGTGLYGRREDGTWETLCLWSELHLEGTVDRQFMTDVQGYAVTLYEQNGSQYCLTLRPS